MSRDDRELAETQEGLQLTRRDLVSSAAALGFAAAIPSSFLGAEPAFAAKNKNELVIAAPTTPPGLDWEFFFGKEVYDHVFNLNDRLTRWKRIPGKQAGSYDIAWQAQNYQGITEPRMAEDWDISKDGKTYTFQLRKGWPSHAGNEFTANDVKWTIDRSFAAKGIGTFFNGISNMRRPQAVKVLNKYTVQFRLSAPTPDLLLTLSTFWRGMVDSTEAKKNATPADPLAKNWMKNNDVGFGPYKLESLSPGQEVVWVAHKEHPFPPKVERIIFREVPEAANRVALLARNQVDVAQFVTPTDLLKLKQTEGVKVWNFRGYVILQSPMNQKFPPLDNVLVRRALSYATPYKDIVDKVYRGFARPAAGPLSDHAAGFDPKLFRYRYDLNKAKELLTAAGFPSGFKTWYGYSTADPLGELVGIQLRTAYAKIGVDLELRALQPSTYTETLFGAKAPMIFFSLGADSPDPHYALGVFYLSTSSNNWGGYKNLKVDACLNKGTNLLNWKQRVKHHKKCLKMLIDDAAWLWIAQPGFQVSTRDNVTGINWYAGEAVDWSVVRFV